MSATRKRRPCYLAAVIAPCLLTTFGPAQADEQFTNKNPKKLSKFLASLSRRSTSAMSMPRSTPMFWLIAATLR